MITNAIIVKDNTPEYENKIIQDYWSNEDGIFTLKVKAILDKYTITKKELNAIISRYSHCEIKGLDCVDCGIKVVTVVTVRYAYDNYNRFERCKPCESLYIENLNERSVNFNDIYPKEVEYGYEDAAVSEKTVKSSIKISLIKTIRKTEIDSPDYANLFSIPNQIVLDSELTYEVKGFINDDNSITLEIAPANPITTNSI